MSTSPASGWSSSISNLLDPFVAPAVGLEPLGILLPTPIAEFARGWQPGLHPIKCLRCPCTKTGLAENNRGQALKSAA